MAKQNCLLIQTNKKHIVQALYKNQTGMHHTSKSTMKISRIIKVESQLKASRSTRDAKIKKWANNYKP